MANTKITTNVIADDAVTSDKLGGDLTMPGHISLADDKEIRVGTGNDLVIKHTGSHANITNTTGNLTLRGDTVYIANGANNEYMAQFVADGAASLRFNNVEELATVSGGVYVPNKLGIGDNAPFSALEVKDTGWSSGSPYGTVAYIEGGAVNDLNWGHLVVSQSGTTTDTGGRISFGANGQNPIAGIRTKYKGATYGDLAFLTRPSGGTNTERMVIDSRGNVGIGVTPESDWYTGYHMIQLAEGGVVGGYTDNSVYLGSNWKDDGNNKYINTDEASVYRQTAGRHIFQVASSGSADAAITLNTAMEIDATGRVGIGTTPAYGKLDVRQTGTGAQDRGLFVDVTPASSGSNNNAAYINVGNGNMTNTVFRIHHESPAANQKLLSLDTTGSNTEKFWVDEDGDAYFAGTVTKPNSPVASYGHATNTEAGCYNYNFGGTGAQSVTCKPTSAVINVGSHFNTSTGKFTCPVAGIYKCEIHGNFYTHYIGDGNFYRFSLRKNSTTHKYHYHTNEANSSSWFYHSYIDIISCAANDTLYWNLDTNNVTVAQGGFGWDAVAWATYDFYLIQ